MKKSKASIAEALDRLREIGLKPGDTVFCVLRGNPPSSGMSRVIDFLTIENPTKDGPRVRTLSYNMGAADLGTFVQGKEGLRGGGCGMDMGFGTVYNLGRALFPDGFGTPCVHCGKRFETQADLDDYRTNPKRCSACSANGHEFRGRNGDTSGWDDDGGYALKHRWL